MNIKRISWVLAAAFAVLISGTVQVAWAAMDAYMVIKGEKQGMIGSQSSGAGAGKIEISDFSFGTDAPASTATEKLRLRRGMRRADRPRASVCMAQSPSSRKLTRPRPFS